MPARYLRAGDRRTRSRWCDARVICPSIDLGMTAIPISVREPFVGHSIAATDNGRRPAGGVCFRSEPGGFKCDSALSVSSPPQFPANTADRITRLCPSTLQTLEREARS